MKCRYCGHEIPDGMLYCEVCGKEVRIVPDYNPLEDMLAAHVKDAINSEGSGQSNTDSTGNTGRHMTGRNASARRNTAHGNTTARMREEREQRRRQAERRKAQKRRQRRQLLAILFIFAVALIDCIVALYMGSYPGIIRRADRALGEKSYEEAIGFYERAIAKDAKKADAYAGLARVYTEQKDLTAAENVFLDALEDQTDNTGIYEACFEFYLDTKQAMRIPSLLADADEKVKKELAEYDVKEPEFSLDDSEIFDDVQQLSITSKAGTVRYTDDGSEPDLNSRKFQQPLQLGEGKNEIRAITVNDRGIPSRTVIKTYVIELPVVDAPAVSPSTGQYDYAQSIEIKVPEGYEAYYTTDGTDPTSASTHYEGPIDMPDGETLFKAVLVSNGGRVSGMTTRNYIRE